MPQLSESRPAQRCIWWEHLHTSVAPVTLCSALLDMFSMKLMMYTTLSLFWNFSLAVQGSVTQFS